MVARKNIELKWKGEIYQVTPGPALLTRIEARPDGFPISELARSERFTDHAWIVFCALKEAGLNVERDVVTEAVMNDFNYWAGEVTVPLCLEIILPAARSVEESAGVEDIKAEVDETASGNGSRPATGA